MKGQLKAAASCASCDRPLAAGTVVEQPGLDPLVYCARGRCNKAVQK